jgi:pimeloyl-ACP methyl ester carboxylesterase
MRFLTPIVLALAIVPSWSGELAFKKEGKGPGVVLLHGLGGSRGVWAEQVNRMKKDHTVLAVDLPGHGDSAGPALKNGAADLDAVAADIVALMRKQRVTPAVVVGHSTGATLAVRVALAEPGAVRGLVLVDAILAPANAEREEAFMKGLDTDAARTWGDFCGGLAADPAQKSRVTAEGLKVPVNVLKAYRAARVLDNVGERAGAVTVPVAFFTSSSLIPDPAQEKEALQRLGFAKFPRLAVSYFVNARHWIMWDEPDTFEVLFNDFEAALATAR